MFDWNMSGKFNFNFISEALHQQALVKAQFRNFAKHQTHKDSISNAQGKEKKTGVEWGER